MTGDWGGLRTAIEDKGFRLNIGLTQIVQTNMHGGASTNNGTRYSGSADLTLTLDTGKLGLWDGGLIVLNGEPKWGDGINGKAGSLLPVNMDAIKPNSGEGAVMTLSEYFIWQSLFDNKLCLFAGKLDASRAFDENLFANDERTQFMNVAFRNNLMLGAFAPYTVLGGGFRLQPTDWLRITTAVVDSQGRAKTTGFETAFHGDAGNVSVAHEWSLRVRPFDKLGNQRVGFAWSGMDFDHVDPVSPFRELTPALLSLLGSKTVNKIAPLLPYETSGDNVMVYYNFDQYLYTEAEDPTQGFGLFGRFGWARQDVNPVAHFYSIGLGGKGLVPDRDRDTCGIGYYFADLSNRLPPTMHSEQGVECYYNIEITPWLHISPDLQFVVDPGGGLDSHDVAIVGGVRVQMSL
ncbi:MAG: carbohydrate porin [Phycisphaerae bacterium]|nr:carbohydrate porin [Phycisphaerae bacterium]